MRRTATVLGILAILLTGSAPGAMAQVAGLPGAAMPTLPSLPVLPDPPAATQPSLPVPAPGVPGVGPLILPGGTAPGGEVALAPSGDVRCEATSPEGGAPSLECAATRRDATPEGPDLVGPPATGARGSAEGRPDDVSFGAPVVKLPAIAPALKGPPPVHLRSASLAGSGTSWDSPPPAGETPPATLAMAAAAAAALAALALALYRRLRASSIHDQPTRNAILREVRSHPGVTLTELASALLLHEATVGYHVRLLAEFHVAAVQRDGRALRVFENGGRFTPEARAQLARAARPAAARALAPLPAGGMPAAELARRLGVSRQAAHKQLRGLAAAGLVALERRGRQVVAVPRELRGPPA